MPAEAQDLSKYDVRDLVVAIAQGMDHQKDSIGLLRGDMVKGFGDVTRQVNERMDKIEGTQERLELRIDRVEKKQDLLEGAFALGKLILILTVGGPILGIIVGVFLGN